MAFSGTNSLGTELLVELDPASGVPLHTQLEAALREAIRSGRLAGDSVVPASRRLADELGVSRGVVVEAYQQLTAEGYLLAQAGGYTRVASGVAAAPVERVEPLGIPAGMVDVRYGFPDVAHFPRDAWLRSLRRAVQTTPNDRLARNDERGQPELRVALAAYLNRVRGTWVQPRDVLVCNGFAQALSIVLPLLASLGVRRFAVEDPSDDLARVVAGRAGMEVVGIPVTPDGLDVAALEASGAQAVLVTPAHQMPIGCVYSPEVRAGILDWARRTGAYVFEDDYDAEYRYGQTPVGALHGLAPDRVIYAGTASKTLAPALRLGWIVLPHALADAAAKGRAVIDRGSPVLEQIAFADFLQRGELDRHLRRMRPIYRARRDALLSALRQRLPQLHPVGIAGGIHVLAWLPEGVDDAAVVTAAEERGLLIEGLTPYRVTPGGRPGLIFGYGRIDETQIDRAVGILAEVLA